MAKATSKQMLADSTPGGEPSVTPPFSGHHDHSFTLQTVMALQKSVGELTGEIRAMNASIGRVETKLDKLEDKVSAVTHKIYAAGVVLTIAMAAGAFFVNKIADLAIDQLKAAATITAQQNQQGKTPANSPKSKKD